MLRLVPAILAAGLAVAAPAVAELRDLRVPNPLDRDSGLRPRAEDVPFDSRQLPAGDALRLERQLAAHGFDPGRVDGVLDQDTHAAIRSYQAASGLRPTGEPTERLLDRLVSTEPVWGEMASRSLLGKPVFGADSQRIGVIDSIAVSEDGRINGVVVTLDGSAARVPVPWHWVGGQADAPTVVLPWSRSDLAWLTAGGHGAKDQR